MKQGIGLDKEKLPTEIGVYLAKITNQDEKIEIDVYSYKMKGLCCYAEDFGSGGTGVDDEHDDHVSVQCTGLEFITRLRDL